MKTRIMLHHPFNNHQMTSIKAYISPQVIRKFETHSGYRDYAHVWRLMVMQVAYQKAKLTHKQLLVSKEDAYLRMSPKTTKKNQILIPSRHKTLKRSSGYRSWHLYWVKARGTIKKQQYDWLAQESTKNRKIMTHCAQSWMRIILKRSGRGPE
jgi:hypothetical protein